MEVRNVARLVDRRRAAIMRSVRVPPEGRIKAWLEQRTEAGV
jgi:hypothetical protein